MEYTMTDNKKESGLDRGQTSGPVAAERTRSCPEMTEAGHLSLVTDARFNTASGIPNSVAMLSAGASAWYVNWEDGTGKSA